MIEFHALVKAFTDVHMVGKPLRLSACLFHTIYFIGIQIFNNGHRKFSKIPLDSAYKYATRSHNEKAKQIIMNEQSE